MQPVLQLTQDIGKIRDRTLSGLEDVRALNSVPQLPLFPVIECAPCIIAFDQRLKEREQELQVLLRPRQRERIDGEVARLAADVQVAPTEDRGQGLKTPTDIEDERQRLILLGVLQQEVAEIRLAASGNPENERVRDLAIMQVQVVRSAVVSLHHGQVLRAKVLIPGLPRQDREQERQVSVIRIEEQKPAKIHHIIAGDGGKEGIELVVGLDVEAAIRIGKDAGKLTYQTIHLITLPVVDDDGQREFTQGLPIAQSSQALAEVLDIG